jgi:hypothetical protein
VVAHRHAARDLQVHQLVGLLRLLAHVLRVGEHQLVDQLAPGAAFHRVRDAQFAQAAVQPVHVLFEAERAAFVAGHHFVDAVAEDEAAVQHAHLGVLQGAHLAVEPAGQGGNVVVHGLPLSLLRQGGGRARGPPGAADRQHEEVLLGQPLLRPRQRQVARRLVQRLVRECERAPVDAKAAARGQVLVRLHGSAGFMCCSFMNQRGS